MTTQRVETNSFVLPMVLDSSALSPAEFSLYLAVLHHGFSCFWAGDSKPASKEKVAQTADYFLGHLKASQRP